MKMSLTLYLLSRLDVALSEQNALRPVGSFLKYAAALIWVVLIIKKRLTCPLGLITILDCFQDSSTTCIVVFIGSIRIKLSKLSACMFTFSHKSPINCKITNKHSSLSHPTLLSSVENFPCIVAQISLLSYADNADIRVILIVVCILQTVEIMWCKHI